MVWLTWIGIGLVVGALSRLLMPGHGRGAWIADFCLGIAGALTGGWIGGYVFGRGLLTFNIPDLLLAAAGAAALLAVYAWRIRHRRLYAGDLNPNAM